MQQPSNLGTQYVREPRHSWVPDPWWRYVKVKVCQSITYNQCHRWWSSGWTNAKIKEHRTSSEPALQREGLKSTGPRPGSIAWSHHEVPWKRNIWHTLLERTQKQCKRIVKASRKPNLNTYRKNMDMSCLRILGAYLVWFTPSVLNSVLQKFYSSIVNDLQSGPSQVKKCYWANTRTILW